LQQGFWQSAGHLPSAFAQQALVHPGPHVLCEQAAPLNMMHAANEAASIDRTIVEKKRFMSFLSGLVPEHSRVVGWPRLPDRAGRGAASGNTA